MTNRGDGRLERAREICMSLPEAMEKETWGNPTFRVRKKILATYGLTEDGARRR